MKFAAATLLLASIINVVGAQNNIVTVYNEPDPGLPAGAIGIRSATGDTVKFEITQLWKQGVGAISWIQPVYNTPSDRYFCDKTESVSFGAVQDYTATCIDGTARVELFVHDGSFKKSRESNYRNCPGWGNDKGIAKYIFDLDCGSTGKQKSIESVSYTHLTLPTTPYV